jgi:hypothetical protein
MKRILLIGIQEHRRSFITRLNLKAGETMMVDSEEVILIERHPNSVFYDTDVDYAICVGLSEENDNYVAHIPKIPSTVYFLDEKETPLEFIQESLKFEQATAPILNKFNLFCRGIVEATQAKTDEVEMKTFSVISAPTLL